MLKFKFCVSFLFVIAPFTTAVLYGITSHKSQHMLPGELDETRTIILMPQCMENKNPDEDKNNDNPYGPTQFEFILPGGSDCFQIYETDSCNLNSKGYTGAYLEYLNTSTTFYLKLENKVKKIEDEKTEKLQNFNFYPKSFKACANNEETKLLEEMCDLSINFKIHYQIETKQVPLNVNLETQIKRDTCVDKPFAPIPKDNKDLIWFEINVIRNDPTEENTIICLELFTQKNCEGSGVRMVLPQQSLLWNEKHEFARIWAYSKESGNLNELVRSIRRCSYCMGRNISEMSSKIFHQTIVSKDRVLTIVGVSASILFAILVGLLVFFVLRIRRKRRIRRASRQTFSFKRLQDQQSANPSVSGQNISTRRAAGLKELCTFFSESHEIPRADINIGDVNCNKEISMIGAGEYTMLYKGRYQPDGTTVAIKTIKNGHGNDMVMRNALEECQILMHLGNHPGIVGFLGVCTKNVANGELFIVMEWCENGTLKGYLNQNKGQFNSLVKDGEWIDEIEAQLEVAKSQVVQQGNSKQINFGTVHLFKWCCEVAEAMEFISSQNIVHVSLSAKNVLLNGSLSCKISDFRSAKMPAEWSDPSNPFSMKRRHVPWRWYAVESLMDEVFNTQTDIWTFGIFMWEVFSMGATPYPDYIFGPEFILCIKHGYRLQIPNEATVEIYQLMLTCWYDDPEKRPSFSKIKQKVNAMNFTGRLANHN